MRDNPRGRRVPSLRLDAPPAQVIDLRTWKRTFRILLVDDHEHVRQLVQFEVAQDPFDGHDVDIVACANPEQALRILMRRRFDLVVSCIIFHNSPSDGLQLLLHCRARWPKMPFVFHSALWHMKDNPAVRRADAFVPKSADLRPLREVIARFVELRGF